MRFDETSDPDDRVCNHSWLAGRVRVDHAAGEMVKEIWLQFEQAVNAPEETEHDLSEAWR
ncbi:MAG: hypothetical protein ACLP50_01290 [Solirubrobacteraceae bacterium]